jgi:hypothetical protein
MYLFLTFAGVVTLYYLFETSSQDDSVLTLLIDYFETSPQDTYVLTLL